MNYLPFLGNINTSVPSWNDCDITTQVKIPKLDKKANVMHEIEKITVTEGVNS